MSTITHLPISSPSVLPPNPSPRVKLALDLFQAFNAKDYPRSFSYISDQVKVQMLPEETFKAMGRVTKLDKATLERQVQKSQEIVRDPKLIVHEIIDSESTNKVVLHVKGQSKMLDDKEFAMEYIIIFTIESDSNGDLKVVEYKGFIDTMQFHQFAGSTPLMQE